MKVLISGATGFTGKWMLRFLQSNIPQDVEIICLLNSNMNLGVDSSIINIIKGNLLKRDQLENCFSSVSPDMIIHLAGLNHGSMSDLLETNVVGTKNLIDIMFRNNPLCKMLIISSSAIYGNAGNHPISEKKNYNPLSEYGLSKTAQEILCKMYYQIHQANIAIARPFNLVGPGQSSSFVCGKIISQVNQIRKGEKKEIDLSEITSCRDFIDVRDVVAGYWSLLSHPEFEQNCAGKSFNIGSGKRHSISQVIKYIEEITGDTYSIHVSDVPYKIQIPTQQANISRIQKTTNWSPKISLKESLSNMLSAAT
jgi:GDP-4-dehydro-6-deoxy-D-mannose reductase